MLVGMIIFSVVELGVIVYLYRIINKNIIGNTWIDGEKYKPEIMTGKDVEEIRIVASSGAVVIGNDIILDLIHTLKQSVLGLYHDDDAYTPPNPYQEVEKEIKK